MFRNLCMLRQNVLLSRFVYSSYTVRATVATSTPMLKSKSADMLRNGAADINLHKMAKEHPESTRNFLTSVPSSEKSSVASMLSALAHEAMGLKVEQTPTPAVEPESPTSNDSGVGGTGTTILDKDGIPIEPIEIDGWKNMGSEDDEDGPTVQTPGGHIEIGNDNDYKAANLLVVPEKREGQFEYKGIKLKLPESANKDVGTYRFRRDPEDLQTVADDIRLAKFEKK